MTYHVIHNGRVVAESSSAAGAQNKALQYGSSLPERAKLTIWDAVNDMHANTIKTEPQIEFEAGEEGQTSRYHVIHNGKVVDKSPSSAGAQMKALEYGKKLSEPAELTIHDPINDMEVRKITTEPENEFNKYSGLDDPIKKSKHPVLNVSVFHDPNSAEALFFKFDGNSIFDINKDSWVDNPKTANYKHLAVRKITPSDLNTMAAHDLVDEEQLQNMLDDGHHAMPAIKTLRQIKKLKEKIANLHKQDGWEHKL